MRERIKSWVRFFQRYSSRWWYAPAISLLAFADLFLVVIPTDGLLVSAVMLSPRRWLYTAALVSLGSSLGAAALAYVLSRHGLSFLLHVSPGIEQSHAWVWTNHLMSEWGAWALFLIALSPIMQHPAIALAAFTGISETKIFLVVLAGRAIKYLFLAWAASHAPRLLGHIWGMQYELEEVGLESSAHRNRR